MGMGFSQRQGCALLVVSYLLTGGLGVSCLLCIEADGHIQLELEGYLCGPCCAGENLWREPSSPGLERTFSQGQLPCWQCVDIPILINGEYQVTSSSPAGEQTSKETLAFGQATLVPGWPISVLPSFRSLPPMVRGDPLLARMRTVILRR